MTYLKKNLIKTGATLTTRQHLWFVKFVSSY
jgi:hypothetical protein